MPTRQDMPTIVNRSPEELDGLLKRIGHSDMNEEDKSLLTGCVEFSSWLPMALEEKEITIAQLRKLLFGQSDRCNKNKDSKDGKDGKDDRGDDSSEHGGDTQNSDGNGSDNSANPEVAVSDDLPVAANDNDCTNTINTIDKAIRCTHL